MVQTGNPALDRWVQAVTERMEVREGSRGNPGEQVVLKRDLQEFAAKQSSGGGGGGGGGANKANVLFADPLKRIGDYTRFDGLPEQVRNLLLASIADEAAKRGADIRYMEQKFQTETESLAYKVSEVTAAVAGSSAGVRELAFAFADKDRAQAGKITQMEASLGNYYQDGSDGRASLEEAMLVTADRVDGLAAEYTVKLTAGGAIAGFGLAASEDPMGATFSEFIANANSFKIAPANDYVQDTAPTAATVGAVWFNILNKNTYRYTAAGVWEQISMVAPFAVDTLTGTTTINGQMRLSGGGGATLDQSVQSVSLVASATVFKLNAAGSPDRSSITLTATLNNGLEGTLSFSGAALAGSGATRSLSYSSMPPGSVTINAQVVDRTGRVFNDYVTIYVARDGANGANGAPGAPGAPGANGSNGSNGVRGLANVTRASSSYSAGAVYDGELSSALPDGIPRTGDSVTLYNAAQKWSKTWVYSGSSWSPVTLYVDGNAVITGTLSAGTMATSKAVISPSGYYFGGSVSVSSGMATIDISIPGGMGTPLYTLACTPANGVLVSHVLSYVASNRVQVVIMAINMDTGKAWSGVLRNVQIAVF